MYNSLTFRSFSHFDTNHIIEIINYHIENGLSNFEENKIDSEIFSKIVKEIKDHNLPFIVCEKNNKIIGFAYLNKFRNKSGYRFSYENSIYIDKNYIGKGIGNQLLKNLIEESKNNRNIKTIIAVIGNVNCEASISVHKKNGFNIIGTIKKVGYKKKQWLDAIYMQLILDEKS
tara:strand:+ start:109 stop:627 length:519 start_codon:yes stop_codon:yes gene_type:complete